MKEKNNVSIIGFVFSILSIITCGITSIVGLILSIIGLNKSKNLNGKGKGLSIAGIVISIIMLIIGIIMIFMFTLSALSVGSIIKDAKDNVKYEDIYDNETDNTIDSNESHNDNKTDSTEPYNGTSYIDEEGLVKCVCNDGMCNIFVNDKKVKETPEGGTTIIAKRYENLIFISEYVDLSLTLTVVTKNGDVVFDSYLNKSSVKGNIASHYELNNDVLKIYSNNLSPQVPGEEACDKTNKSEYIEFVDTFKVSNNKIEKISSEDLRTVEEFIDYYEYKCN